MRGVLESAGERYTKEQLERMDSPEHPAEFGVTPPWRTRRRTRRTGGAPAGPGRTAARGGGATGDAPFNRNDVASRAKA